jgi:hypothetical protein
MTEHKAKPPAPAVDGWFDRHQMKLLKGSLVTLFVLMVLGGVYISYEMLTLSQQAHDNARAVTLLSKNLDTSRKQLTDHGITPSAPGPTGAPGVNGSDGAPGKDGAPGPAGQDGKDGAPGAQGPAGPVGPAGVAGQDGKDGKDGRDGAPPASWTWTDPQGVSYTCTEDSGTDPAAPHYTCKADPAPPVTSPPASAGFLASGIPGGPSPRPGMPLMMSVGYAIISDRKRL